MGPGFYKNFLYGLQKIELNDVYIILDDNISAKLYEYCISLDKCSFEEGSYHTYYGDVKRIIEQFVNYWMQIVNDVVKLVDRYTHVITKAELLDLVKRTISIQQTKQVHFGLEFLPVATKLEQEMYEEIDGKYKAMLERLFELQTRVERFDKQSYAEEYVKNYLELSIKKINECFQFTHTHISLGLRDSVYKIRTSLEESLVRASNNLKQLKDKSDRDLMDMLNELYEKNKEHLHLSRQDRMASVEYADVLKCIKKLKQKIESPRLNMPVVHLENEVEFWQTRLTEILQIDTILNKVKKAQKNIDDLEIEYNRMSQRMTNLTGMRYNCFMNIAENIKQRKEYIEEKMLQASRALVTFFGVRGISRVLYKDHAGNYNMDDFGHKMYYFDHGKNICHVTCDGTFKEVSYKDKYYYDDCGRYVVDEAGKKVYQAAACTSTYNLGEDGILYKTTVDCGHSQKPNRYCKMELKDPNADVEILPEVDPISIKGTLEPEIVKYLWDCFGHIVPDAMCDVKALIPTNPIHILGHRIFAHKYGLTLTELQNEAKKAEEYRADILKKRKEKWIAESKAWRSKQVKRRKPEESDDSQDWATYNSYLAQNQFISSMDCQDD